MASEPLQLGPKAVCYVTVDVVGFSRDRTVPAQVEIVQRLNAIVGEAVESCGLTADVHYRPSGDEICICITLANPTNEDLRLAMKILELTHERAASEPSAELRFALRIGINQNTDNVVKDINGVLDFLGGGINHCHEVMRIAGAQQIVVSQTAWDRLHGWGYPVPGILWTLSTTIFKHGDARTPYQFRADPPLQYLSNEDPPVPSDPSRTARTSPGGPSR